ncbi:hypothetical protein RhiirA4_465049, partial [Rhizophagus irregularis]
MDIHECIIFTEFLWKTQRNNGNIWIKIFYRDLTNHLTNYLTCKFGKSGNAIIDDFILEKYLRWIPYSKFKNVEYLSEGGFGTIYRAIWLKNNGDEENDDEEVILKCPKNLNESLSEFLKEWEYHISVLISSDIINVYGFTEDPSASKYMVVMEYANK